MLFLKELLTTIWYVICIFLCWVGIFLLKLVRFPMDLFEAGKEHAMRRNTK